MLLLLTLSSEPGGPSLANCLKKVPSLEKELVILLLSSSRTTVLAWRSGNRKPEKLLPIPRPKIFVNNIFSILYDKILYLIRDMLFDVLLFVFVCIEHIKMYWNNELENFKFSNFSKPSRTLRLRAGCVFVRVVEAADFFHVSLFFIHLPS